MVVFLSQWLKIIPMAALVAVMIMVSIGTFNWDSVKNLRSYPLSTNAVMLTTVMVVVFTHNLAFGVCEDPFSIFIFANKISRFMSVSKALIEGGTTESTKLVGKYFLILLIGF